MQVGPVKVDTSKRSFWFFCGALVVLAVTAVWVLWPSSGNTPAPQGTKATVTEETPAGTGTDPVGADTGEGEEWLIAPLATADPKAYAQRVTEAACTWNTRENTREEMLANLALHAADPDGSGRVHDGPLMRAGGWERHKGRGERLERVFDHCAGEQDWQAIAAGGWHQTVTVTDVIQDQEHKLWGHAPQLQDSEIGGEYDEHYVTVVAEVQVGVDPAKVQQEGSNEPVRTPASRRVVMSYHLMCSGPIDAHEPMCTVQLPLTTVDWA